MGLQVGQTFAAETADDGTIFLEDMSFHIDMTKNETDGIKRVFCDNEKLVSSRCVMYGDAPDMIEKLYGYAYDKLPGNDRCDAIISYKAGPVTVDFWLENERVIAHEVYSN